MADTATATATVMATSRAQSPGTIWIQKARALLSMPELFARVIRERWRACFAERPRQGGGDGHGRKAQRALDTMKSIELRLHDSQRKGTGGPEASQAQEQTAGRRDAARSTVPTPSPGKSWSRPCPMRSWPTPPHLDKAPLGRHVARAPSGTLILSVPSGQVLRPEKPSFTEDSPVALQMTHPQRR